MPPDRPSPLFLVLALVAATLPLVWGFSVAPSSTYFNQAFAVAGWALCLMVWAASQERWAMPRIDGNDRSSLTVSRLLWGVLAILVVGIGVSGAPAGQRAIPVVSLILAAAALAAVRRSCSGRGGVDLAEPLMVALLAAGLLNVVISLVQVFAPQLADGWFVSFPTSPGRAIGNVRQPNQLSTILLWASGALVWLSVRRRWPVGAMAAMLAGLVFALVLTASRTGSVGIVLLGLWGAFDKRLPRRLRIVLVAAPFVYALIWLALSTETLAGAQFYGNSQVDKTLHGDPSSSRIGIWRNTLSLIAMHPWLGVGFGEYNFAWTMSAFPNRPVAFFDHSHNLPLQLAVEFGIPAALAVLGLAGWAMWTAREGLSQSDDLRALSARTALFMLALVGLHSMLEYPLWYTYFLLPSGALAGWYFGMADAARKPAAGTVPGSSAGAVDGTREAASTDGSLRGAAIRGLWVAGASAALAGSVWAGNEYWHVAQIFDAKLGPPSPLAERIARGQRGFFFGHHADYALVTTTEHPEEFLDAFDRPLFHLLDTRLMIAYAKALEGNGRHAEALDVAARIKEFKHPEADEFFEDCADDPKAFPCGADPALPYSALLPQSIRATMAQPAAAPAK